MSIKKTQQQKISSLRRKDTMWIYKNPQGLQILEDELNERRKKRSARHRKSPRVDDKIQIANYQEQTKEKETPHKIHQSSSPLFQRSEIKSEEVVHDAFIPIAKKTEESKVITIANVEEPRLPEWKDEPKTNNATALKQSLPLKLTVKSIVSNGAVTNESKVNTKADKKPKEFQTLYPKESTTGNCEVKPGTSNSVSSKVLKASVEEKPSKVKEILKRAETFNHCTPEVKTKSIVAKFPKKSKIWDSNKKTDLANVAVNKDKLFLKERSTESARNQNIFPEAKRKLLSVQQDKVPLNELNKQSTINTPVKRRGLVSSFVSVYESPSMDTITATDKMLDFNPLINKTESRNPVKSRSAVMGAPLKPPRRVKSPLLSATSSSPELPLPSSIATTNDSYFTLAPSQSEVLPTHRGEFFQELSHCDKERAYPDASSKIDIKTKTAAQSKVDPSSTESIINVYLPQLSPELSFCDNGSTLDIPDKEEGSNEENVDVDTYGRPCIKKRVSFSDQLLTYIPDKDNSSISNSTDSSSISSYSCDRQLLKEANDQIQSTIFIRPVDNPSDIKANPMAQKKETSDKCVPAVINPIKKQDESISSLRRPGSVSNIPQRLSNTLLDIFQQKLPNNEIKTIPKRVQPPVATSRELTHLTKTRPRKPPSLKKPTYPAATAQPNWRMRATNKKYEFVA